MCMCVYIYIYIYVHPRPSGVHKVGFSKGGFSDLRVVVTLLLLNALY